MNKNVLNEYLEKVTARLGGSFDITKKTFTANGTNFGILYISTISNDELIASVIFEPLQSAETSKMETVEKLAYDVFKTSKTKHLPLEDLHKEDSQIISKILQGHVLLICENFSDGICISNEKFPMRNPEEPPTSPVIFGPRVGFVEDLAQNIGLLRKRLMTDKLKLEEVQVGKYTNTKIAVAYLSDVASKKVVRSIIKTLKNINIDGVVDSYYIVTYFQKGSVIFKQVGLAEKPDIVVSKLLEGRVAIIVDGSPVVITLPFMIFEDLQNSNDYYSNSLYASFIRFIRLIGVLIAVIIPGVYLSLRLYHYKVLPLKYLITITNSTQGLPFTPFIELLFILLLFQMLYEVSLRLPRYLGLATSIVGALILGQTGVSAGLISPPGVVIIAISIIAVYVIPEQVTQLSILRAIFLILGGTIGLLGIVGGMIYFINHMAGINKLGTSYLAPYAPRTKPDLKDGLVKAKQDSMKTRPESIKTQNKVRGK